jgi:hypothetical protein
MDHRLCGVPQPLKGSIFTIACEMCGSPDEGIAFITACEMYGNLEQEHIHHRL